MHRQQTTKALACSVPMGMWAWLAKRCLALIPSSLEMPTWALAFFFFFFFNDNSQETWESGGRSSSNRHIWRGRKGLEERTSTQAEVNMANSKLLGENSFPNPCWHPPYGRNKEMRLMTRGQGGLRNTAGGFGHGCGSTRTFCSMEWAQA